MDELTETGLTDLSLYPLDPLGFMKDGCEGTSSSPLYPTVLEGTGLPVPLIIYPLGCRGVGLVDLPFLWFMRGWFKGTGSPTLYALRFEGTGLTDLPRLYSLDSPGFSRDGFGRTGSSFLNVVEFGGTGLLDSSLSCPTRLGFGGPGLPCLGPLGREHGLADRPLLEWREEPELPERFFCFAVVGRSSPSDTEPTFSRPLDREEVLLSLDSELSVLWEFSWTVLRVVFGMDLFGMDQRLDLRRMGEEARVRPSLNGVGVRGQSFRQSAGMFSADIEISLKKRGGLHCS